MAYVKTRKNIQKLLSHGEFCEILFYIENDAEKEKQTIT
jgi:hypothetical protein